MNKQWLSLENWIINNINYIYFLTLSLYIIINYDNVINMIIILIVLIYLFNKKINFKIMMILIAMILFYIQIYSFINFDNNNLKYDSGSNYLKIKIVDSLKIKENYISAIVKCQNKKYQAYLYDKSIIANQEKIKYGQSYKVKIKKIEKIQNIYNNNSSFKYDKYMKSKKINTKITITEPQFLKENKQIIYKIKNCRLKAINYFKKSYPKAGMYINSLIFGYNEFDEKTQNYFQDLELIQMFTISGMHIVLIISLIENILLRFDFKKEQIKKLLYIILPIYGLVAGWSLPVRRAILMKMGELYLEEEITENTKLSILMFLLIVSICINPFYIANVGFVLTYLITYILIINKNILNINNNEEENKTGLIIKIKNTIKIKVYQLIIVNIFVLPILINLNYSYNLLLFIFIIFYELIVNSMLYLSILIIIMYAFNFNFVNNIFDYIYSNIIIILNLLMKINSYFVLKIKHIPLIIIFFYYKELLKIVTQFYYRRDFRKIIKFILITLIILANINVNLLGQFSVIDVGQGDSILIKYPLNGKVILIDTGSKKAEKELLNYLDYNGVKKIDYLIITHLHEDHIGNLITLCQQYKIKNLVFNNTIREDLFQQKEEVKNYFSQNYPKGIKIPKLKITFIKDVKEILPYFYIFAPLDKDENINNNSLIIKVKLGGKDYLLMGDAEKEEEEKLILKYGQYIDIDYLKVGHHGSKTSTSEEFLEKTTPNKAYISSGKNNKHKHPAPQTLTTLEKYQIQYKDTQKNGEIKNYFV